MACRSILAWWQCQKSTLNWKGPTGTVEPKPWLHTAPPNFKCSVCSLNSSSSGLRPLLLETFTVICSVKYKIASFPQWSCRYFFRYLLLLCGIRFLPLMSADKEARRNVHCLCCKKQGYLIAQVSFKPVFELHEISMGFLTESGH